MIVEIIKILITIFVQSPLTIQNLNVIDWAQSPTTEQK